MAFRDRFSFVNEERIEVDGVPARLYQPEDARGLLLLGHGGASSKDDERFVALGRQYAEGTGLATVCVDIVGHGERRPASVAPATRAAILPWILSRIDQTVADWKATAAALSSIGPPVAYAGFSMGMLLGVPTVLSMPEIKAVVFGVGGVPAGLGDSTVIVDSAAGLADRQVLMLNMTKDDVFAPSGALEFFAAIPGRCKRIMFWEGDHIGLPAEAIRYSVDFVKRHSS
jgi:pimeloyl-ACP methyl ester carboxylesterase